MNKLLWILSGVCLIACNSGKKIDQTQIAQEMRNREVVRITPAQLTAQAWTDGKRLSVFLDSILLVRLQGQLTHTPVIETAKVCHVKSLPVDSVEKTYPVQIKRLAFALTPASGQLSGKEYEVWDAYKYQFEQQQAMTANVQQDGEELLYSQPIVLSHSTCLQCHGIPGKDLAQNHFQQLKQTYPDLDSLSGYALGQPIGLWSFRFTKAALVRQIAGARK